jgi:ribonuclease BN (tRNA processing enzyme)
MPPKRSRKLEEETKAPPNFADSDGEVEYTSYEQPEDENSKKRKRIEISDDDSEDGDPIEITNDSTDSVFEFAPEEEEPDEPITHNKPKRKKKKLAPLRGKRFVKKIKNRKQIASTQLSPKPKQIGEEDTNPISIDSDDDAEILSAPSTIVVTN